MKPWYTLLLQAAKAAVGLFTGPVPVEFTAEDLKPAPVEPPVTRPEPPTDPDDVMFWPTETAHKLWMQGYWKPKPEEGAA